MNHLIDPSAPYLAAEPPRPILPRNPSRLQVALYFEDLAATCQENAELWQRLWGQYYEPETLTAFIEACKRIRERVNE